MADKSQLAMLKKGVDEWNRWRRKDINDLIDLFGDTPGENDLSEIDLSEIDLSEIDLSEIDLSQANFRGANLIRVDLREADLSQSNLVRANLNLADLIETNLIGADLRGADLLIADLMGADLRGADLRGADLNHANLMGANLMGANLTGAIIGETVLGDLDLSEVKGLDEVKHEGPSTIGTDTLQRSKGRIPEMFLRRCGLRDWEIESAKLYREGLSADEGTNILYRMHDLRFSQALQINPLFISYSHKDGEFVNAMEKQLDKRGVRFWRDIHDATAGRLESVVDRAMRLNPTVLLVLSKDSVQSDWVEHEARKARTLEKELGKDVLCPVALDDAWKGCQWPERLREQIMEYNILDFSKWEDEREFGKRFGKLIEGLDLFYKEK